MKLPDGPITLYALRLLRQNHRLKAAVRARDAELAAVHEVADVMQQRWLEERTARVDLELLHGWLGSEAT